MQFLAPDDKILQHAPIAKSENSTVNKVRTCPRKTSLISIPLQERSWNLAGWTSAASDP